MVGINMVAMTVKVLPKMTNNPHNTQGFHLSGTIISLVWLQRSTNGLVVPSCCTCESTAPNPTPEASVSNKKSREKSGKGRIGA